MAAARLNSLRSRWRRHRDRLLAAWDRFAGSFARVDPVALADVRAKQLLLRMLSDSQREELNVHGYFSVQVPGRGLFCIFPRTVFNVLEVRTGDRYCCVPEVEVPLWDLMLAQKLLIENDPQQFFAIANRKPDLVIGPQELHQLLSLHARRSMSRWREESAAQRSTSIN